MSKKHRSADDEFAPVEAAPLDQGDLPLAEPVQGKAVELPLDKLTREQNADDRVMIQRAEEAEQEPLKKEVWAKMGRLKDRLATLDVQREHHAAALEKIHWERTHTEAQYRCLRGFVNWEKALKDHPTRDDEEYNPDDVHQQEREGDLNQAGRKQPL